MKIQDNGCGFIFPSPRQGKDHFSGIGMNNVAERLKIYYGEAGGLTIHSKQGEGTTCLITIPPDHKTEV